jgi:hypothetical protein
MAMLNNQMVYPPEPYVFLQRGIPIGPDCLCARESFGEALSAGQLNQLWHFTSCRYRFTMVYPISSGILLGKMMSKHWNLTWNYGDCRYPLVI